MYQLDEKYKKQLDELATEVQASEELANYLEEEEEVYYNQLKEQFEPRIMQVYAEVAEHFPLQLVSLEQYLLDEKFEGLFLPRILGFAVLRGEIDDNYKYVRPQDHFRDILLTIANSANFEQLRKRIGQSIQVGFALSSDIWVTNLINEVPNKKVRQYLESMKVERMRFLDGRREGYRSYARQFRNENFLSADFPTDTADLTANYSQLKRFLLYRLGSGHDNSSLQQPLFELITNADFDGTRAQVEAAILFAAFMDDADDEQREQVGAQLEKARQSMENFEQLFFEILLELYHSDTVDYRPESELWLSEVINKEPQDDISGYFLMTDLLHELGYESEEVQEKVKGFHNQHPGLSLVNDAVRQSVYRYFHRELTDLDVESYPKFFELVRYYPVYMQIFANQQFNQLLKELSLGYVRRLKKRYTDKRGKDYQDIKKFTMTNFVDLGFLTEKQTVELFKTKRKKKAAS